MIYKHKFLVGINSVNKKFKMKNKAILECLENTVSLHSIDINQGIEEIYKNKLTWILVEWDLEILERPKYNDEIEVRTLAKYSNSKFAYKDFEIYVNGKKCVNATSKWIVINLLTKQIVPVTKEYVDIYSPEQKEAIKVSELGRIEEEENFDISKKVEIRKSDMDINGHMHNLNYLDLIAELMDFDEEFDKFRIIYKKEIKYGQDVYVLRKDKVDNIQFLIKDKDNVVHSIIECKR